MRRFPNTLVTALYLTLSCQAEVILAASPGPFYVCTDYHCDEGMTAELTPQQWAELVSLLTDSPDPAEERQRIRKAVAAIEQWVGEQTGTWRDLGGNFAGIGEKGQLDCISESKNTTTYLGMLEDAGLLHWHITAPRKRRNPLLFNIHWAAVIIDRTDQTAYAVDSWYLDNGHPPYIQRLDLWLSGRRIDSGQENLGDKQRFSTDPEDRASTPDLRRSSDDP